MLYVMIQEEGGHSSEDLNAPSLTERMFLYDDEEARDAQLAHDKEFFPEKVFYIATMDDNGEIQERKKV